MTALLLFTLGSALCAMAWTIEALIFRVLRASAAACSCRSA